MLNRYIIAIIAISLLGVGITYASSWRFLKDAAPIAKFTEEDFSILKKNVDDALENIPDGEKLTWKNSTTGHSGLLNPINTYEANALKCRKLRIINKAGDKIAESHFNFCKQKDGEWKIVSSKNK